MSLINHLNPSRPLAVGIAATKSYLHAWEPCLRSVAAAAQHHRVAHFLFATDTSPEAKAAVETARAILPPEWKVNPIPLAASGDDSKKDYGETAQLRIARLQGALFAEARRLRAGMFWSVESDNIIPADALRVLEWTLAMPCADGRPYYDIAAATYFNGLFLGGFGTPQSPINEDFLPHERNLPARLRRALDACEARLQALEQSRKGDAPESDAGANSKKAARERWRRERLQRRARKFPPSGNIFSVNGQHGWRRRGWMDFAYPGIGRGSVVPIDWCGLGCTLISSAALAHADFVGYDGRGTQDLFLCWRRWHPAGLRLACVPHIACDHVKRKPDGSLVNHHAFHEVEGENRGHLRVVDLPFF